LIKSSAISKRYSDGNLVSSDKTRTAQQLATDYLKALKSHLVSTLGRELGDIQAQKTPLEFVITFPAVWSEPAKEKTLLAAEIAGLAEDAPIHMISEPVGLLDL
jgi:molecular chaperone DnaK (HSP70)